MQPASGDFVLSPATPRSSHENRRLDAFTTRRLSVAIDALRREGEAILWEMNSLKTQITTLEQRIMGQTEELDMISRNLSALKEQHKIMEQQYQEKLRVLRSELRAAQEGQSAASAQSTDASTFERERRRSLSSPDSLQLFGNQHSPRRSTPLPPPLISFPNTHIPASPVNRREQKGYMADNRDTDMHSAAFRHTSPTTLFQSSSRHSPYETQHRSPDGNYKQSETHPHNRHDRQRNAVSPTRLEPSLSPTLVGSCSDGPCRSKPRNHAHAGSK